MGYDLRDAAGYDESATERDRALGSEFTNRSFAAVDASTASVNLLEHWSRRGILFAGCRADPPPTRKPNPTSCSRKASQLDAGISPRRQSVSPEALFPQVRKRKAGGLNAPDYKDHHVIM